MNLDAYRNVFGWFSDGDAAGYREMIAPYRDAKFAEVGSFMGRSAISIADIVREKSSKLFCVDTWLGSVEHQPSGDSHIIDLMKLRDTCEKNLRDAGALDVVTMCQGRSEDWARYFREYKWQFEVVFIDGNHDELAKDLRLWLPLLKPGGTIGGHDYASLQSQVREIWPTLEGVQVKGDVFYKRMQ